MLKSLLKSMSISVLIISIVAASALFTGCSGSLEHKLTAHKWVRNSGSASTTYTFFENGTFEMTKTGFTTGTDNGTWEIDGNELTISTFKQPFTFKDIGDNEVSEDEFNLDEWYVSDRFFYLNGLEYIAQD